MSLAQLDKQVCPVARTLAEVGDAWTFMILRELFLGQRRFEDIRVQTGMSPQLLSQRLRDLAASGIIERRPYQDRPPRFELVLTDKGLDLWPVVVALRGWGERWAKPKSEPALLSLTHKGCGHVVDPIMTCPDCGEPLNGRAVRTAMADVMRIDRDERGKNNRQGALRTAT